MIPIQNNAQIELIPAAIAFALSAAVFPFYIRWLKREQIGQYIREEGPQSHAIKAKTPTMGGLCFIVVSTLVSALWLVVLHTTISQDTREHLSHPLRGALFVILIAAFCGLVGFVDDYGKITSRSNKGLSASSRLVTEFILGGILGMLLWWQKAMIMPAGFLPFNFGSSEVYVNAIYIVAFIPFLVAATTNALNLHDGMDGLAGGTSIQVFAVLSIMLAANGHIALSCIAASMVGALGGFLLFNRYKAQVFMGDTGSLYIGGLFAALVTAGGLTLWFVPLALIYVLEAASVMAQVVYFKLTKPFTPDPPMPMPRLVLHKLTKRLPGEGKRLFRMAPLHHHYEAIAEEKGIVEWKVVACFWLAQFILCAGTLAWFFSVR